MHFRDAFVKPSTCASLLYPKCLTVGDHWSASVQSLNGKGTSDARRLAAGVTRHVPNRLTTRIVGIYENNAFDCDESFSMVLGTPMGLGAIRSIGKARAVTYSFRKGVTRRQTPHRPLLYEYLILEAMEHFFVCPYCGERISMVLDISVDGQTYVEDCEVCCQPVEVRYTVKDDEVLHFEARAM